MAKNAMNVMTLATALRAYRMRKCGIASSHLTKISQRASCSGYWMSKRSGYPGAPATAVSTDILHPFPLAARELLERELRFPLEAATAQTAYVSASGPHLRPVQHGQPQRQAVLTAHQRLAGPLRVRHHPQHVPAFVDDARDVARAPVGVRFRRHPARRVAVAEHPPPAPP